MSRFDTAPLAALAVALLACDVGKITGDDKPAPSAPAASAAAPAVTAPQAASAATPSVAEKVEEEEDGPVPEIPEGRSKPPTLAEWADAPEINTQEANSQPDKCFMKIVREWLKVNCAGDITHTSDMKNFGKEGANFFKFVQEGKKADFVVRLREGKVMKLRIHRGKEDHGASLFVNWPQGKDRPTIVALGKLPK